MTSILGAAFPRLSQLAWSGPQKSNNYVMERSDLLSGAHRLVTEGHTEMAQLERGIVTMGSASWNDL